MKRMLALGWLESTCWAVDDNTLKIMADIAEGITGNTSIEALLSNGVRRSSRHKIGSCYAKAWPCCGDLCSRGDFSICQSVSIDLRGNQCPVAGKGYNQALNDPSVSAIMLDIDSPGGEVSGIHEMSEMIFAGRSKKKTVAYIGGQGCSAAYWLASSASEVVIDATASVGSIGVVMTLQRNKKNENIEFVSSQSPKKHLDPASSAGRSECQKHLDVLAGVFIDRVARNMKVNRSTVLKDFGRGGVLMGKAAVKNRMVHKLGSFEGVIKQLGGV
ncbi:S49 family peptidase (plasmid) [Vibrio anguillarum]|uniref:S49 family peptidase n=1 Tax=Vibrio anguillarum TaxID=55601 RepID=A0A7U6FUE0_VIBAN|nr:S49 family peptidase [Vibrio anguillarum]AZS27524.1 S49 family peptidase [Vibrio anguillarum]